ncbi:heavy metal translocating P-type ATPase [Nostocoides sp. F2B08]|uniref:heavy metal translocating P-type ATPase n=1 Tax=Nostocoides sp. F2B08 TaxID=2653936 RepID=UPI0012633AE3|nr:heavy metal translocating P-type ATPase [Tetrasphaera sp. F2B08]KAB7743996.1 heavy metal translocating P-type ATPase [Tetrasphaera sp. F2B08]
MTTHTDHDLTTAARGTDGTTAENLHEVDLAISGMTCASCSARVEKKLNRLDGCEATVNLATEKAKVRFSAPLTIEDIMATVEKTGYGASLIEPRGGPDGRTHDGSAGNGDAHGEHDHMEDIAPVDVLKRRALIAAALTVPVVILAMAPGMDFAANPWLQLALTTPVVLWAAWPFHRAAAINARHLASTMDTLVSIGVSAAYLYSLVGVLSGAASGGMAGMDGEAEPATHLYFETAAVITTFLLMGRWMEARAKKRGKSALETLLTLGAKDVAVLRDGGEQRIPIEQLAVGEEFVVRPGEKVATDGVVVDGASAVDASMMTGEPVPLDVGPGDDVTGGTVNAHGRLIVRATAVGAETTLAAMARLVEDAQTGKAPVQRLADRVSAVFVPVVLVVAVLTLIGWWVATGEFTTALPIAITVLIIACPCALGLATPTALLVGTGRGAELGVLIKGPQILEDTRRVNTALIDKTGTVTTGEMTLQHIETDGEITEEAALLAAAAVESGSEHPIARAVTAAAAERGLQPPAIRDFAALAGSGARAVVVGSRSEQEVTVGRADLFETVPESLASGEMTIPGTRILVGWDGRARAALTVTDTVRGTSAAAIGDLAELGLSAYLLTGDNLTAARSVARAVGIPEDRVIADVRPEDKYAVVERLQREGKVVAMVGDGVNDAAALAQADLGLAMGSGTDVAMNSADIVLMRTDLASVPTAIGLSRQTLRTIKQNLGWAFAYNTAAIPLAVAGLLNPMIAGGAMALSSVLVVTNSLRLRRFGRH